MALSLRDLLIALHHIPGLGPIKWQALQASLPSPEQLIQLSYQDQARLLGDSGARLLCDWLADIPGNWLATRLARLTDWLDQPHHHLITQFDEDYPELLREVQGPLLLHVAGEPEALALPQIAIVGSRKPTAAGRKTAQCFASVLAEGGFVITSGLALGIDGVVHEAALTVGGKTVAVLGSGLDGIYPASHRALAERIVAEGGALVSEFALGVKPEPGHFPRRNRIISGLSLGTLVVEAALKSGSLITARLALEQNREVFAIPGSIYSAVSEGCNWLIREGAQLVSNPSHIVEHLGAGLGHLALSPSNCDEVSADLLPVSDDSARVLHLLGTERMPFEALMETGEFDVAQLHRLLNELELQGSVISTECGYERLP
ncbi:DNA-processing protein DprA [Simiduia aestuariiviva]|uniref:DNA processing protein n=1 Tax=Simiduia aestuariiviva TaxID=1510459 RepID=A0A839UWU9_9GAMM|nr:DNA-processing protein DprA [Simiduia aestuariiviva]MBB3169805.1 DNA processing protein [Simiduia aestuariiviva]